MISESVERAKLVCFVQFRFKKWLMLGFIGFFAWYLGGNLRIDIPEKPDIKNSGKVSPGSGPQQPSEAQEEVQSPGALHTQLFGDKGLDVEKIKQWFSAEKSFVIILIIFLVVGVITFFAWLAARLAFVFIEDVKNNDASLRLPFIENRRPGNSLFFLYIFCGILNWGATLFCWIKIFFILYSRGFFGAIPVWGALKYCVPYFGILFANLCFWAWAYMLEQDILVPIMAKEKAGVSAALSRAKEVIAKNFASVVKYTFIKLGIGVCTLLLQLMIFLVLIIPVLFLATAFALMVVAVYMALPEVSRDIFWTVFQIVYIPLVMSLGFFMSLPVLPFAVFYRSLSLKFLAAIAPEYDFFPVIQSQSQEPA